ncbi:MAG: hypothetical protein RLZZ354_519 [Pseudomonadota bacterium]
MKYEITNLIKHGIPEDVATISVCLKYNKKHLVEDLIEERRQEQELIREELEKFVEFSSVAIMEPLVLCKSGEEFLDNVDLGEK